LVFIDPAGAFASVALRPLWGLVAALILVCAALPPMAFMQKTDADEVVRRELKKSGALEKIPQAQHEEVIAAGAKMMVAFPLGAAGKRALWILLLSILCIGLLKGSKPDLAAGPVLGAVSLAMAPLAVHDVLMAGTFLSSHDVMALDFTNPVLSNPAALFGIDAGHSLGGALVRGIDFFELWSCFLVGYGANAVVGVKSPLPYVVSLGGHLAFTLMSAVSAAVASGS